MLTPLDGERQDRKGGAAVHLDPCGPDELRLRIRAI